VDKTMDKLSLHTAGVTTTWLAGAGDPRRPLDPRVGEMIQAGVTKAYGDFVRMAAAARKMSVEQLNEVAQGRVWTGREAKAHGLVDRLGTYEEALKGAAARAKLGDKYRVEYVEREPRGVERLLGLLFGEAAKAMVAHLVLSVPDLMGSEPAAQTLHDLRWLRSAAQNPFSVVAHCLCEPR
jgi:protease-4